MFYSRAKPKFRPDAQLKMIPVKTGFKEGSFWIFFHNFLNTFH
jgi:hypothetical protein